MNISIIENGNLKLELEYEDIDGFNNDMLGDDVKMSDAIESYSCNGSYEYFDAGDGNPNVGLTSAPCIAEQLIYLDDGTKEIIGKVWYYDNYMIKSFIDELVEHGFVIFILADD